MSLKIEFINDQPMINHQQQSQQAVKIIKDDRFKLTLLHSPCDRHEYDMFLIPNLYRSKNEQVQKFINFCKSYDIFHPASICKYGYVVLGHQFAREGELNKKHVRENIILSMDVFKALSGDQIIKPIKEMAQALESSLNLNRECDGHEKFGLTVGIPNTPVQIQIGVGVYSPFQMSIFNPTENQYYVVMKYAFKPDAVESAQKSASGKTPQKKLHDTISQLSTIQLPYKRFLDYLMLRNENVYKTFVAQTGVESLEDADTKSEEDDDDTEVEDKSKLEETDEEPQPTSKKMKTASGNSTERKTKETDPDEKKKRKKGKKEKEKRISSSDDDGDDDD